MFFASSFRLDGPPEPGATHHHVTVHARATFGTVDQRLVTNVPRPQQSHLSQTFCPTSPDPSPPSRLGNQRTQQSDACRSFVWWGGVYIWWNLLVEPDCTDVRFCDVTVHYYCQHSLQWMGGSICNCCGNIARWCRSSLPIHSFASKRITRMQCVRPVSYLCS